jgi:hypothetical protein
MEYSWQNFSDIGYVHTKFTDQELAPLKEEIKFIENNFETSESFTGGLAGHLRKEYLLSKCKDYLENLILPLVVAHETEYPNYKSEVKRVISADTNYQLSKLWVNFQKKNEFNPIHTHSGVYSFVIWIKIPYDLKEELNLFPQFEENGKLSENKTSCFEFLYLNSLGKISQHTLQVDKNYENVCVLFPANMPHQVYPFFTSDEYRISVSGNFSLKV